MSHICQMRGQRVEDSLVEGYPFRVGLLPDEVNDRLVQGDGGECPWLTIPPEANPVVDRQEHRDLSLGTDFELLGAVVHRYIRGQDGSLVCRGHSNGWR